MLRPPDRGWEHRRTRTECNQRSAWLAVTKLSAAAGPLGEHAQHLTPAQRILRSPNRPEVPLEAAHWNEPAHVVQLPEHRCIEQLLLGHPNNSPREYTDKDRRIADAEVVAREDEGALAGYVLLADDVLARH